MAAVIALLTDFGLQDPYVGVMKGVIADLAPRAKVVDLCHGLPPQDVRGAALFLRQSAPYFPKATLFVVVVDPGVGSDRRVLYARTRRHSFLAPDNGALSWLPDPVLEWRSVVRRSLFLAQVSSTFHGRDLFAPVAARLSRGLPPSRLGGRVDDPERLPWPAGEILAIDRFGNAVTSLGKGAGTVLYKGRRFSVRKTYADARDGEALALAGSGGLLELSVRNGSFLKRYGARRGDKVYAG